MEDITKKRKEQLRALLKIKQDKEDMTSDIVKPENPVGKQAPEVKTPELNTSRFLENPFTFYQDIFKYNWNSMINSWYQNHRHIAPYARKPGIETPKIDSAQPQSCIKQEPTHPIYPPGPMHNPNPQLVPTGARPSIHSIINSKR